MSHSIWNRYTLRIVAAGAGGGRLWGRSLAIALTGLELKWIDLSNRQLETEKTIKIALDTTPER